MTKKAHKATTNYLVAKPGANLLILGLSSAELDTELESYYVDPDRYVARALDFKDPAVFFVGPKGAGKSAILQMIRLRRAQDSGRVINITPDDLAFSALANITASTPIMSDASKNQWLFKALWDYILALEVLRREHKDRSSFSNALHKIVQFFFGNSHQKEADRLLAISLGDDGRQMTLSSQIIELVKEVELTAEMKEAVKVSGKAKLEGGPNKANHLWLLNLIHSVAKRIGENLKAPYHILIDDLDLHWQDLPIQNAFIAALFMSLRAFAKGENLKCVVAIRDQIYRKLPLTDRDKYHDWVCNVEWESPNLKKMIERRITSKINVSTRNIWGGLLPDGAFARMYKHSYGRPREAIRLASLAVAEASRKRHTQVEDQDLDESIRKFSDMRITEISDEFSHIRSGLEQIIRKLGVLPKEFQVVKLKEITGDIWIEIECKDDIANNYPWAGGYAENPKGFGKILLECGILLYKATQRAEPVLYDVDASPEVSESTWVAIHPVFWPALGLD
ncbi:MAG TPA: hypothetical protein VFE62_26125 [Gemmataceae bacterium]|nr:hypothetical protein [Gemmataceae bacterium]